MAEFGFFLKKLAGSLFMPLPVCLVLFMTAYYFLLKDHRGGGFRLLALSLCMLLFFSVPITSNLLIEPFEYDVPKLDIVNEMKSPTLNPKFIWVLGCYHNEDVRQPIVSQIHPCSLTRIVQGIQLSRIYPDAALIFSGSKRKHGKVSHPQISADLAIQLGLAPNRIIIVEGSKDTEEGIKLIQPIVKDQEFIAVSSASHMSRMKKLFNLHRLKPILSPAEYLSANGEFSYQWFVPNATSLAKSERAIYEMLGNIWVSLKMLLSK